MILIFVGLAGYVAYFFYQQNKNKLSVNTTVFEDDEYSTLLKFFDLEETATEDEIKAAYRSLLKQLHPDAKILDTPKEGEKRKQTTIDEVKKTYHRIQELRNGGFNPN